jgi:threonine aldolase
MTFAPPPPPPPPPGLPPVRVNLYSDTQTLPTAAMKAAMMEAELGDEQGGTDPTVTRLCERMAAFLGKQAAVFLPSGTMCNQIAILTHCRPGDEILAHETAHILTSEGGGAAALTGAQITGLAGANGQFSLDTLKAAIRPKTRYAPPQTLMEVEQTANLGGGAVWKLETLNALAAFAHEMGMATHMDGARLTNATVAAGIAPAEMVAGFDSVWLDFTKGLGAPGAGSSGWAAPCARAASAPRPACMRWTTMWTGWPRTMRTRGAWRAAWPRSRASAWRSRRPTWCSSTPPAPA